jgi:hypothetical protein
MSWVNDPIMSWIDDPIMSWINDPIKSWFNDTIMLVISEGKKTDVALLICIEIHA